MKKMILGMALLSLAAVSTANASTLSETQKRQVLEKISQLESVNGYDVEDNIKLVNQGTDAQVKEYLVTLVYNVQKRLDNPNEQDLIDLKAALEKESISQLVQ